MPLSKRRGWQRGIGLVEVLVASGLLAVGLVVLLGSISSLLVGGRTAERQVVEERLARNQIESLMAQPYQCPGIAVNTSSVPIDVALPESAGTVYAITATPRGDCLNTNFVEWVVTVSDRQSGAKLTLTVDQAKK